jgi:hypothetical protein
VLTGPSKNEVYASFVLDGEGGPYVCSDFDYNVEKSNLQILYSKTIRTRGSWDWDLFMNLSSDEDTFKGSIYSRNTGYLGELQAKFTSETSLIVKSNVVGVWNGECTSSSGTKLILSLSLEAGQRSVENPPDYDLAFTPSKVGSLRINDWLFPIPSVTFDYLSGRLHCVHKVLENGPRLQLVGVLGDDRNITARLESAQQGLIGSFKLIKA